MITIFPIVASHNPGYSQWFSSSEEIDQLPVSAGVERGEDCQEINSFQQAGFALSVRPNDKHRSARHIDIQTGKIAKIGER